MWHKISHGNDWNYFKIRPLWSSGWVLSIQDLASETLLSPWSPLRQLQAQRFLLSEGVTQPSHRENVSPHIVLWWFCKGFLSGGLPEGGRPLWWLSPLSLVRPRTPLCRCPAWPPTPPGGATLTNRNCTESSGAWLRGTLSQTTLSSQPGCYHPVILDTLFTSLI